MKKIIVTGCNGQLGRAINQIYENLQKKLSKSMRPNNGDTR